jgi:hypothetical protein
MAVKMEPPGSEAASAEWLGSAAAARTTAPAARATFIRSCMEMSSVNRYFPVSPDEILGSSDGRGIRFSQLPHSEFRWMQHFNLSVTGEVVGVERENVLDAVNHHGRNQPGVVCLLSTNPVCGNQAAPFHVDGIGIRKPDHRGLNAGKHSLGLAWSEAEPIGFNGSGADRPELDEILRRDTKPIAVAAELVYGVTSLTMLRICPVKPTKENVGIDQDVHYRFQSSSRV